MKTRFTAILLVFCLLLPVCSLAENAVTQLPYGLSLGLDCEQTEALLKAEDTLKKYDKEDYGAGSYGYLIDDVVFPGTEISCTSMQLQIDTNNSADAERLTSLSFDLTPAESSIATFRTLLKELTAQFGQPSSDPFGEDAIPQYEEWGTLEANWQTDDLRVSLYLSRMYEESVSVQYNSRKNYDRADLAE